MLHSNDSSGLLLERDAGRIESLIIGIFNPALTFHQNDIDWFYERHVIPDKQRNSRGIAYTPTSIVNYIVERTVAKPLRDVNEHIKVTLEDGKTLEMTRHVERLVSYSVMDPACGTGRFLANALEAILLALSDARKRILEIPRAEITLDLLASWDGVDVLEHALSCQIHGMDEDPDAVALACFHVMLAGWEWLSPYLPGLKPGILETVKTCMVSACKGSIVVGNALLAPDPKNGFDAIIGNPPYVNYKKYLISLDRKLLERKFRVFNGQADLSYYFFEIHHNWLAAGGTSSQITSRYFMEGSHATKLRDLLEMHEIIEIVDLNDIDVFPDLGIHLAIITWRKQAPEPTHEIEVFHPSSIQGISDATRGKKVPQASISTSGAAHGWTLLSRDEMAIKRKFDAWPSLGSIGTCISGSETGLDKAFVHHVHRDDQGDGYAGIIDDRRIPLERELVHGWVKNGDIERWSFDARRLCIYVPPWLTDEDLERKYPGVHTFLSCFKKRLESRDNGKIAVPWYVWRRPRNLKNLEASAKIIMPYKASVMRAAIDTGQHYCSYDVTIFIPGKDCPDIRYILAVLNSRATWWYFSTFGKRMGTIFELYPGPVSNIRIPVAPAEVQARVCELVDRIVMLDSFSRGKKERKFGEQASEIVSLQEEINEMVEKLAGLTDRETNIMLPGQK